MREAVYIMGCNRSGTTLLQNLFRCAQNAKIINGEISPITATFYMQEFEESNLVMKRLMGQFFGVNVSGPPSEFKQSPHETRYTLWIDFAKNWHKMHYIHIRRDPRDSLVSTIGTDNNFVSTFPMWKSAELIYEKLLVELPDKIHLIKYEELVSDVSLVMDGLFNKIGLVKDLDYSKWFERVTDKERAHPFNQWLGGPRPVDANSIGKWCGSLSALKRLKQVIEHNHDFIQKVVDYGYAEKGWEEEIEKYIGFYS